MSTQRSFVGKNDTGWDEVAREGYTPDAPSNVVRHTIVGGRKADQAEGGPKLEIRYFEVPPGSVSRLEKHEHEHYVIVGQGVGVAVVGEAVREIKQHDVVYVGPLEPHQFVNRGTEPFGFFCVVTAERDYAQLLSTEELERLKASPAGAFIDPHGAPPPRHLRQ
jgi:quercetin dioxygenase-like cupin family protein